jgi:subtilase family serine protease
MRRFLCWLALVVGSIGTVLTLAPPVVGQRASRLERQMVNGREVVAGEVLVKFRDGARPNAPSLAADVDALRVVPLGHRGALRLQSRSLSAATLLQRLKRRPDVVYAEPNFIVHAIEEPNDPRFDQLWGLRNIGQVINGLPGTAGADIHAASAWEITLGSTANVVGIIDTGIDYTHQDLAPNVWSAPSAYTVIIDGTAITCAAGTHGFNAIARTCDPMDDHNHGTHVSGTIGAAGNNGLGVVGVNWTTQLMGIKFLDASGSGTTADSIAAVEFAIAVKQAFSAGGGANIRVLSNSWGGPDFSQALLDEVNAANAADILVVAGAGNDSFDNGLLPFYPASFDAPNVVAVAATTRDDDLAWFSNYGASSVHLGAPGEDILSTTIGNTYAFASGTSMATPHVSGAAALVLSRCDLDTAALKDTLLGSVDPLPSLRSLTISGGRVNVNNALHACTAPPDRPTGLTASGSATKVTLAWSKALGALRYNVKRSQTPGGPYATVASVLAKTSYADVSVVNDTTYYYVVSAVNGLGESADSDEASATPFIQPDVVVSSLVAPVSVGPGSTIAVTVTTKNLANGSASPSTTRLYLSDDTVLSASDLLLGAEQAVPALAAGASSTATLSIDIPSTTTAGTHFLIVKADADNVLNESNEANNSTTRTLVVGSDLMIFTLTAPATGAAGGTMTVTDTIKNQGAGQAAASRTRFYFSANSVLDAGDLLLPDARDVPALASGSTNTGTTMLTIPSSTVAGTYFIIGKADGDNAVAETNEINNTSSRSIQIGADLVVSALSVPGNGGSDSTVVASDTTKNQGGATAAASVTRFYLSANAVLDTGDVLLGGRDVPSLSAGASSVASTTLAIPPATASGAYYILAKADGDGAVPETSETNNTTAGAIQIGSDLVVSAMTVPAKAGAEMAITVSDTVTNQGGGPASPSTTKFYLSANSTLDGGDVLLPGVHQVPDLTVGASAVGSTSLLIPPTAPGPYNIIAKADADNVVIESRETNNTQVRAIQIGGDLIVSTVTAPAKAGADAPFVVSDTTTNQGGGPVGPTVTRIYLSANTTLDASDPLVGSRTVPDLTAGAMSAGSTTVTLPPNTLSGSYYLIARADADGSVPEVLETNNTFARAIPIGSDLSVSALALPATAGAGASIVVNDTTANQGGGGSPASSTRFYLSTNSTLDAGDVRLDEFRTVPALAAGASSAGSTSVTIPPGTAAGAYFLFAKADDDNVVGETSETNNTSAGRVTIGPDLTLSTISLSATSVAAGSAVVITDTVANLGAGAALPSVTRFYLSANAVFDAGDLVLAPGRAVPGIGGGTTSMGSTSVTIPADTAAGSYYVFAKADGDGAVGESVETNNVSAARLLQITKAP